MYLGKIFKFLNENEIAGSETINPIVTFLRGLRSASPYIELNPNACGGMSIDLDIESLKNALDTDIVIPELQHTFKATVNSLDGITVSSGTIYFGRKEVSISSLTDNVSNSKTMYVHLTKSGSSISGSLVYGNAPSHMVNISDGSVNLPICTTTGDDHEVKYYHVGDFFFANEPQIWWTDYDASKTQFSSHDANGDMVWIEAGNCEE